MGERAGDFRRIEAAACTTGPKIEQADLTNPHDAYNVSNLYAAPAIAY